tara:strand:- start:930 stop:1667 length:738 start_codon:yes stop_codon:yes gene_type:complete
MLGISELVSTASNNVAKKIQEHFILNKVDIDSLKILILGNDISNCEFIDELIIQHSKKIRYDHSNSGFCSKTKKYIAYVYFDFSNLTVDSIIHEIKHVYVDWCIFKNGGTPIKETKEAKSLYTEDFSKLMSEEIHLFKNIYPILRMYYYSTKLEIPSFLENYFFDSSYVDYKSIALNMVNFNVEDFENKECESEFKRLKLYDIPVFKNNKDYECFLKRTKKLFKIRGKYILRKINKLDFLKKQKK